MTTEKITPQPWLLITSDLKKDGLSFGFAGLIFGIIQFFGYRYFDKAELGSELLQEHIAINSLFLMVLLVTFCKILSLWLGDCLANKRKYLDLFIEHIVERSITFGSVAASVICGFAISVAIFGAYAHAAKFFQAAIYFASVSEFAASPLQRNKWSKGYYIAVAMVFITPFCF